MERPKQGGLDIAGSTLNAEAREQADVFAGAEQEQEAGNHSDVFLKENMARPKQGGMETTCSPMASEIKDTPSVQVAERTGAHAGAEQKQDSPHRCLFVSIWEQESADAEPFLTINDAVAAANDGDAVRVDCLDCKEPHGLVIDKAIVLQQIPSKNRCLQSLLNRGMPLRDFGWVRRRDAKRDGRCCTWQLWDTYSELALETC